jgi:polyphosphate kinase
MSDPATTKDAIKTAAKEKDVDKTSDKNERADRLAHYTMRHPYMQNRELSWLEFNKRVLELASDESIPLFERLNFVSIYWSNLQEFFMIRVGSLTDLALLKKEIIDPKSGMTPTEQLDAIYARVRELYPLYEKMFFEVREQLATEGVHNLHGSELTPEQDAFAQEYFDDNVMPFLSPQIVNTRHPFPHLENGAIYIVVRLDESIIYGEGEAASAATVATAKAKSSKDKDKDGKGSKGAKDGKQKQNRGAEGVTLGLIPLPKQCDRIVELPGKDTGFVLLEHLIEHFAPQVFSMYKIKHTNIICVTRNADLDATEGSEEQGEDYREHMKKILKKRKRLAPVRLESERELSNTVKKVLLDRLNLKNYQTYVCRVPLDMSYVFDIPSRVSEKKRRKLSNTPFTPAWPAALERTRPIIEQLHEKEVLLSFPYQTMNAFVQLLREAAVDPAVISIKITLYRLASQSHIAEALIAAAENGKEVTAVFELRARFDESNNIEWSQRFEQAGCNVLYGYRDYKIHSKICVITRQSPQGLEHITQIGTGNYNEKTARLYTDLYFLTCDAAIGRDAMHYFHNIALENISDDYDILWVSPLQIKQKIIAGTNEQIALKREGKPAELFFKTNSITDRELIEKIVEASQAGVKCTLLVRGISCLVPGIVGFTENVRVVSIVGRLLEHSRIYVFGPLDDATNTRVYLSSADLMTRNMDKRVEVAWPILNNDLRAEVIGYINTCLADTAKLRELLPDKSYTPLGECPNLFDAQSYLIEEAQRKHLEAAEKTASRNANISRDVARKQVEPIEQIEPAEAPGQVEEAKQAAQTAPEKPAKQAEQTATTTKNINAEGKASIIEKTVGLIAGALSNLFGRKRQ